VTLYVSMVNVNAPLGAALSESAGPATAQLVSGAAAAEGSFVAVPSVTLLNGIRLVAVPIVAGTGQAVWEAVSVTNAIDSYAFGVYISYTANQSANSPPAGSPTTVDMSYTPPSATSGTIPRFAEKTPVNPNIIFTITPCETVLLFPFVTDLAGTDTGLAIANTTSDPFGTVGQAGTCKLNWYSYTGSNSPPPQTVPTSGTILSGATWTSDVSSLQANGFEGYVIAQCNFQYAHGFAFISTLGLPANGYAMGYLALVIPDPSQNAHGLRPPQPFPCTDNGGFCQTTGEQLGQ